MSGESTSAAPASIATRFKPGNPGRRKGSLNKRTKFWKALADQGEKRISAVVSKMFDLAEAGDVRAADLVLARYHPAPRNRKTPVRLPDITTSEGLGFAYQALAEAVALELIDVDEAQKFAAVLDGQRRNLEDSDTQKRLKAVEATLREGGHEPL